MKALREGADGVMIAGCHPGECHYVNGNIKAMRRFYLLKAMLKQLGVEEDRIQLVWASASEGILLAEKVDQMTEALRALGPLNWDEKVIHRNNGYKSAEALPVLEEA
jgi:F420-non-reducing hydrogenase iron-sulfur subunit